ncbi:isochorismatase family protein [Acidimangrovimonas pyrenivorans]|uniref:Isochorismatase family protein n=1 Tax=Acidimangrovimonas pyrenivorans TaxID=2030798 RepID=A0ABV7AGR1_9RHOB
MADLMIDRARSVLAVIDVQDGFLDKLEPAERAPLVARIAWLMRVARALELPVIAMGEDLPANGPPVAPVLAELPPGTPVHDKRVFGLAGEAGILSALQATGRDQAVLVGLETDVCVAQSALGLAGLGWTVAVAADGCGAPGPAHAAGLARLSAAGVIVGTVKSLYYEWVRDLDTHAAVKAAVGGELPEELSL